MPSIFSRIIAEQEPGSFVYRDELVVAFLDVAPITTGHTLVVPVQEVSSFSELDERTGGRIFRVAGALARAIPQSGIPCEGVNLLLSDGEIAGQEVFHAHLHVIPRYRNDGFSWSIPAYSQLPSRETLDNTAENIRKIMLYPPHKSAGQNESERRKPVGLSSGACFISQAFEGIYLSERVLASDISRVSKNSYQVTFHFPPHTKTAKDLGHVSASQMSEALIEGALLTTAHAIQDGTFPEPVNMQWFRSNAYDFVLREQSVKFKEMLNSNEPATLTMSLGAVRHLRGKFLRMTYYVSGFLNGSLAGLLSREQTRVSDEDAC